MRADVLAGPPPPRCLSRLARDRIDWQRSGTFRPSRAHLPLHCQVSRPGDIGNLFAHAYSDAYAQAEIRTSPRRADAALERTGLRLPRASAVSEAEIALIDRLGVRGCPRGDRSTSRRRGVPGLASGPRSRADPAPDSRSPPAIPTCTAASRSRRASPRIVGSRRSSSSQGTGGSSTTSSPISIRRTRPWPSTTPIPAPGTRASGDPDSPPGAGWADGRPARGLR